MKIPKSVTILGRKFTVKVVSKEYIEKEIGPGVMAGMNYTKKSILVSNNMSREDMYITYLHEICHVGMYVAGLNQVIPSDIQELLCETLANTFYDSVRK